MPPLVTPRPRKTTEFRCRTTLRCLIKSTFFLNVYTIYLFQTDWYPVELLVENGHKNRSKECGDRSHFSCQALLGVYVCVSETESVSSPEASHLNSVWEWTSRQSAPKVCLGKWEIRPSAPVLWEVFTRLQKVLVSNPTPAPLLFKTGRGRGTQSHYSHYRAML